MSKSKKTSVAATLTGVFDTMQKRISDLDAKLDVVTKNAAKGFVEQKQAIADNAAGTSYALDALKTSTQRAFDGVSNDIKTAASALQSHNARISKLEGSADKFALDSVSLHIVQASFDGRLARLESKKPTVDEVIGSFAPSVLEEDLKEVFKKHGYDVNTFGVKRQTYQVLSNAFTYTYPAPTVQHEGITVEIGGSKKL